MQLDKNKIDLLLARKQITQSELARRAGVSPASLSNTLIRDGGNTRPMVAGRLAEALGVDVEEILKDDPAKM